MLLSGVASPRVEMPLSPLSIGDLQAWDDYENKTAKIPKCWKLQKCDLLDKDVKVHAGVTLNDCCDLCLKAEGCVASVWKVDGTCSIKDHASKQIIAEDSS